MVAIAERLRSVVWPSRHSELTPRGEARRVISHAIKRVQRGKSEAALLIRETDGSNMCHVFTDSELQIPIEDAYGILNLHGRIPNYHSKPIQLSPDLRVFTHPSVGGQCNKVVFEAVEQLDPKSGKRLFVDVWAKRRTAWHDALFENNESTSKGPSRPRFPTMDPDKAIEVRLKIPY